MPSDKLVFNRQIITVRQLPVNPMVIRIIAEIRIQDTDADAPF